MTVLPIILATTLTLGPDPGTIVTATADSLIDVGGHYLRFEVREGTRSLTIVLEAGGAADASSWATVPDSLSRQTGATIVTYDRAGLGRSELGPADRTPEDEVRDLRHALDQLGTPAPTLLVAPSYGAMLAVLHAALYPDHIRGLVLVDPMNSVFVEETGDFAQSTVPDIEPGLGFPIVVVTAGEPWWDDPPIDQAWRRSHEVIAGRSSARELVVAEGSGHDVPEEHPDVIVDAVKRVLTRIEGVN